MTFQVYPLKLQRDMNKKGSTANAEAHHPNQNWKGEAGTCDTCRAWAEAGEP